MIKSFIYRFGSNDKRSLRWFLAGLLLFVIAGAFIALGYYDQYWWQMVGLVIAVPAVLVTLYGYLGILANRFAQVLQKFERKKQRKKTM